MQKVQDLYKNLVIKMLSRGIYTEWYISRQAGGFGAFNQALHTSAGTEAVPKGF